MVHCGAVAVASFRVLSFQTIYVGSLVYVDVVEQTWDKRELVERAVWKMNRRRVVNFEDLDRFGGVCGLDT